jgi:glycosyltransferase involved in cell wall biosynthesis
MCGWAMQTKLLVDELRNRGVVCEVLKINEGRATKSPEYVDVQGAFDYLKKIVKFASNGFEFHGHVNGESKKGYVLAVAAVGIARLFGRPAALTFHGGLPQRYLRYPEDRQLNRLAFWLLFRIAGRILCNSGDIKHAICAVGIQSNHVECIPGFSNEYLDFTKVTLSEQVEAFVADHRPLFFSYVSFRPEYRLETLRVAMSLFRKSYPQSGFIWVGFPAKEMSTVEQFVSTWSADERSSLMLLGNLSHHEFLTILSASDAFVRTAACDGVSASVLESLALGIPVVASDNGRRPDAVMTYSECDAADLCDKLLVLMSRYDEIRSRARLETLPNNVARTADWLLSSLSSRTSQTSPNVS